MDTVTTPPDPTPASSTNDPFLSLKSGSTEIYLIRHADALPGAEEVTQGTYDDQALSEVGRRQAQALGDRMRQIPLAAVYSSPIGRARETAGYVARALDLDVRVEPDLREVALGPIGLLEHTSPTADEIAAALKARLREIALVAVTSGSWSSIPGSEPSAELRARLTAAVERIASAHPGQRIAAVSHAGAINAYLAAVLGIERDYFFPTANTAISILRLNGERRMLFSLNDIGHLLAAGLFTPEAAT
jgi:probable phosphoglycerate mutase